MSRYTKPFLLLALLVLGAGIAAVLWPRFTAPALSEVELRDRVFATLQQEADTSFIVTGYLDLSVSITAENTRVLFPRIVDLPLGTTRSSVTAPGRVSYGFDLSALEPEMIHLQGDTVSLEVPFLQVFSAEPRLEEVQVETTRGWARMPISGTGTERLAIARITEALRGQGEAHLDDSIQPSLNTAEALRLLLDPVLRSAGMTSPYYRIYFGESLVLEGVAPSSVSGG
jgi:hypothetical protein